MDVVVVLLSNKSSQSSYIGREMEKKTRKASFPVPKRLKDRRDTPAKSHREKSLFRFMYYDYCCEYSEYLYIGFFKKRVIYKVVYIAKYINNSRGEHVSVLLEVCSVSRDGTAAVFSVSQTRAQKNQALGFSGYFHSLMIVVA